MEIFNEHQTKDEYYTHKKKQIENKFLGAEIICEEEENNVMSTFLTGNTSWIVCEVDSDTK